MINLKYLYVLTSDDSDFYLEQTLISITSLRMKMPNAFVSLLCDAATEATLTGKRGEIRNLVDELVSVEIDRHFNKMACSRLLKTSMRRHVKGDFLYLDSDTVVAEDLSPIADMGINLGAVLDCLYVFGSHKYYLPILQLVENLHKRLGFIPVETSDTYFNSGIIFCKDCPKNHEFFDEWHRLWLFCFEQGSLTDQQSLYQANYNLGNVITELDGKWNCQIMASGSVRHLADCKIIHYHGIAKENPYLLSSRKVHHDIKETGIVNQEIKNMLISPRALFSPDAQMRNVDSYEQHQEYQKILKTRSYRLMIKLRRIAQKTGVIVLLRAFLAVKSKILGKRG